MRPLRQAVDGLTITVRKLGDRIDAEASKATPAERSAWYNRIARWNDEIVAVTLQIRPSAFPVSLTEDPRVHGEAIGLQLSVSPEAVSEADERIRAARERGRASRGQILQEIGTLLSAAEVGNRLKISVATVNSWRRKGRLLALQFDGQQYMYPAFQFAGSIMEGENGIVADLPKVLNALVSTSNWGKVRFLLDTSRFPEKQTPMDILRQGDP